MILWLNGLIYCDTEDKTDRQIAAKTAVELLKQGINLLIYPEGIWNVTPNRLVLPLFAGVIKMAYQTGVNIIPIAIEQYGKEFVVNIGAEFCVPVCEAAEEEYKFYIEKKRKELRDVMATLKWEILESRPMANRDALGVYEYEHAKRVRAILSEWCNPKTKHPYYNSQIIAERTYRE